MNVINTRSKHTSLECSGGSSIFTPASQLSPHEQPSQAESNQLTVAEAVVKIVENLGVRYAFGVSGGGIGPLWATLNRSQLQVLHFRHESGAAFAAIEAYFASGRPVVVFTTTGPGITNALTGLFSARGEGAKVIFLSAATPGGNRGRWACQETSAYTMPVSGIFTSGKLFNYATTIESGDEIPEISRRLALGLAQPGSFVAHISIPTTLQMTPLKVQLPEMEFSYSVPTATEEAIAECGRLLSEEPFAIWVGFGATHAAPEIRQLAEITGAAVMTSPRGKGIFPENHPQFVGVTGFSGHESVLKYMQENPPKRMLVLGTRLGEPTSFWNPVMVPSDGFIHVDIDPEVPGVAYPGAHTFSIHSEVKVFLKALLRQFPKRPNWSQYPQLPRPQHNCSAPRTHGLVRPSVLMDTIQRVIIRESDTVVMAEAGNSFAWATHLLQFDRAGQYRISTGFGAMGHAVTGVVGAALGRNRKAVAIVGDGAMLMNNEISTAVRFQIPAVWIVLNDGRYNMCAQGMALQGFKGIDTEIPSVDFAMIAKGMGADGIRVNTEMDLEAALEKAIYSSLPFVVDVVIDANQPAPIGSRIQSLIEQGAILESEGE
ncbi:MAG: ScyA-related TPP-binding enzyme [Scytonema sp. PMC 1069.18]|nr:ScyA-related TPP-binding enzyme [Scytonema sp. PMC 1069.18]MEC4883328.1 ScyA-related TPP-binding enzyme [Scytonema sp. PMC 1070.18]